MMFCVFFCVLTTVRDKKNLYVGGCSEMVMARAVSEEAINVSGKESVAMESFSKALLELPTTISDNGGFDSAFLVSALRAAHNKGKISYGLDMKSGGIAYLKLFGIIDSHSVKRQLILPALHATQLILLFDNFSHAAFCHRTEYRLSFLLT